MRGGSTGRGRGERHPTRTGRARPMKMLGSLGSRMVARGLLTWQSTLSTWRPASSYRPSSTVQADTATMHENLDVARNNIDGAREEASKRDDDDEPPKAPRFRRRR